MKERPKTKTTSALARRLAGVVLTVAVLATACSSSAEPEETSSASAAVDETVAETSTNEFGPTSDEQNTIAIAERFSPSTAALAVMVGGQMMLPGGVPPEADFDPMPLLDIPVMSSSGSGFVIDIDGTAFLVTNFHVVETTLDPGTTDMLPSASIMATFPEHSEDVPLSVVGVNPSFDLALLAQVDPENPIPDVLPLPIADSDEVVKGQKTIAIGNPFGLGATVTTGVVSSVGRFIQSIGAVAVPMIQTDAAINPGNSGGALINSSGEVIGVNTAIFNPEARAFAGIGFSVPSNLLREALANLELGGVSMFSDTRPIFGAQLGTLALLPPEVRNELDLPDTGVAVLNVMPGGPAESAGLRVPTLIEVFGFRVPENPDIIIAIDG